MSTLQVYNEQTGGTYNIEYTVDNAILYGYHTGRTQYYIRVYTTQKGYVAGGAGATFNIPAEIVVSLDGPDYDVTAEMKKRSVVIMDAVSGYILMSSSSSSDSTGSSSSSSTLSSRSSASSSSESSSGSSLSSASSASSSSISEISSASSSSQSESSSSSSSSSSTSTSTSSLIL